MDNFTEFYSYNIPDNVSDIAEQPLYILVACWGFRRKQFLTTSTVAKEFLITQRRAMDILHYIKNEGSKNITFENKILFTTIWLLTVNIFLCQRRILLFSLKLTIFLKKYNHLFFEQSAHDF